MYRDADGNVTGRLSLDGALAAGIPGIPAGLAWLAEHYGKLPLATSLGPAMRLALDGFPVDARYVSAARFRAGLLKADPVTARVFLTDGEVPAPGDVVRQPELARTLAALAAKGRDGFYAGTVAQRLVAVSRPGTRIMALVSIQKKIPERPLRFVIRDQAILRYETLSAGQRDCPRHNEPDLLKRMAGFKVDRGMLLRNGMREYSFVRDEAAASAATAASG